MSKRRQEIRGEMRRILTNLDPRWIKAASVELCREISQLLLRESCQDSQHLLAWTSFFPGEPDLSRLIGEELQRRAVYLPRALPDHSMQFIRVGVDWDQQSAPGAFGIPEPADATGSVYSDSLHGRAVVLVPGLAFDSVGNRIGRGKGYYDRFLARPEMAQAVRVGVCWSIQMLQEIPVQSHDMPVDWICHERGTIRCENARACP